MVKNGERYETIILYKINGLKRLQNHVHCTVTVRSRTSFQKRKNYCKNGLALYYGIPIVFFKNKYSDILFVTNLFKPFNIPAKKYVTNPHSSFRTNKFTLK